MKGHNQTEKVTNTDISLGSADFGWLSIVGEYGFDGRQLTNRSASTTLKFQSSYVSVDKDVLRTKLASHMMIFSMYTEQEPMSKSNLKINRSVKYLDIGLVWELHASSYGLLTKFEKSYLNQSRTPIFSSLLISFLK